MKIAGRDREFFVIGENVHTTRVVMRKGKLIVDDPNGNEAVRFYNTESQRRYLIIPEKVKESQDYEEGRVKHVKIAALAAMDGDATALEYIARLVQRQVDSGANFLDLNVDEISLKLDEQKEGMKWLVGTVQQMTDTPLSIDSSNIEIIESGLQACAPARGRHMLNSASLERLEALDLAARYDTQIVVTASGQSGMPQSAQERVDHVGRMVDAAQERKLPLSDLFIDPLIFPISVDSEFGNHSFDAIRQLRQKYGEEIHISGGFSNVSFGLPCRRIINDAFFLLAVDAGADSAIMDPVTSGLDEVFSMDRNSTVYQLAADMLLGHDRMCKAFLRAYRKGELQPG